MDKTARALIYGAGAFNVIIGVFHILFWFLPLFNWSAELARLSEVNRGVMQVLNLCLLTLFFIMAGLLFLHAEEMRSTPLGRSLLFGFSVFWLLRFIEQFIFWDRAGILPLIFAAGFFLHLIPWVLSLQNRNNG